MYESITANELLARMLSRVPNGIDKREGSIIYDALMPAAIELKKLYIELDVVMNETFADTATRQYLIKRAAERGLVPYPATAAIVKAEFNQDVPIGARFNLDDLNYTVTRKIDDFSFEMVCETLGSIANDKYGMLIPIEYIEGLETAELTEILFLGEDEEETEAFRQRYFDSFTSQAFGGNIADYRKKVGEISGVGGVKVYTAAQWNGGGTVKCVITNSEYGVPSNELIDYVQTAIDPVINSGDGLGIAPIGHFVTIKAANGQSIDIGLTLDYEENESWDTVYTEINNAIDVYFHELNVQWATLKNITVRIAQIESRVLQIEGIIDVRGVTLNGSENNITLDPDSLCIRGDVIES